MIRMDIRDVMKWAYCEELPHLDERADQDAILSSYGAFEHLAKLGCFVDGSSTPADQLAARSVHPDALAIHEAVSYLAAEDFDVPAGWAPFPDLDDAHGLIAETVAQVLHRRQSRDRASRSANLIGLVIHCAMQGVEPEWRVEQPKERMAGRDGRPGWFLKQVMEGPRGTSYTLEVNGYDAKRQRPKPGAYRKWELTESFDRAVMERIDWYLWRLALERLHSRLDGRLEMYALAPLSGEREPWAIPRKMEAAA